MKYIRTKDHLICKVKNEDERTISYENSWESGCLWKDSYKNGEIKQADTIEELCDEFVAVGIPFRTFIVDLDEIKRSGLDIHSFSRACYMQYKKCAIYGAIYTEKGLIYVAKMNDKGELELL